MRPPESFIAQPVRSLQTMLRVIAQDDQTQPSVIPDGIYGEQTQAAVSVFQRNHALPATGVTDQATWEAIYAAYVPAIVRIGPAQPLELILEPGQVIGLGSRTPNVYVIQAVLQVLSDAYASVSPPTMSGTLDEATSRSLSSFQELAGLPTSGTLDKITWKNMAIHYPLAASRIPSEDLSL